MVILPRLPCGARREPPEIIMVTKFFRSPPFLSLPSSNDWYFYEEKGWANDGREKHWCSAKLTHN